MDVQITSFQLNQFLRSPGGGKTIPIMADELRPTIDVTDFIYRRSSQNKVFVTSFATPGLAAFSLDSGLGFYRLQGYLAGFISNGVNAGTFDLQFGSVGFSNGFLDLVHMNVGVSAIVNIPLIKVDAILDFTNPLDDPSFMSASFSGAQPAAVTAISIGCYFDFQRVL